MSLFIYLLGWCLFIGACGFIAGILVEKLLAYPVLLAPIVWFSALCGVLGTFIIWICRFPRRMETAILVDERLNLKERVSTALALAGSGDEFAQAACAEAREKITHVDIRGHFPLVVGKGWFYAIGVWIFFGLLLEFLPQYDLLGILKKKEEEQELVKQLQTTQKQIEQTVGQVNTVVKQLGNSELSSELAKFELPAAGAMPEEAKRDAIKKLGDLSDRIKQMQKDQTAESLASLEKMLSQLKTETSDNPLKDFSKALSQSDFKQAAAQLQDMQKQIEQGQLPELQKQAMKEQFQKIAKQLEQSAGQQKELEQELQKQGLDKKLAKMDPEQVKKMLEQQGIKPETLEQLMDKMKACQAAGKSCSNLAQAAGSAGMDGSAASMEAMLSELQSLDEFAQQAKLSQAAMDQIEQAMAALGEGMSQGVGGMGPYKPGTAQQSGSGTGGPGRGFGERDKDEQGDTTSSSTKVKGKTVEEGPVIASWYFKDNQEKGEATRELKDVIQAGRDSAAQAIDENQIPKKYEKAVKSYFGNLEEEGK
ncbi:MAG: hypothetical protein ABFD91_04505 [Anaerohalosphaeraceae bacterium]